jgi:hypothetical protein
MDKKIKRIKFEYLENVRKDENREVATTNNINMWFRPFVDEINKEKGEIVVTFDTDLDALEFKNMSEDLRKRANEEFGRYRVEKFYVR